jgi:HlyD family secretion protein
VAGDLRTAEAQRNLLQHQQEALTKLLAQKAATQDEVERNRIALEKAGGDVDQLRKAKQEFERQVGLDRERLALIVGRTRTQIADLQGKLAAARVVAPVNGTLFSLPVHARDFVHTGDLLADVADLHQVRVRAYIDEPELGKLEPGQAVQVTWNALPDRMWMGRTENVPRQVVARGARSVGEVLCSVSNDRLELIPNTTVDVRIQISERPNILTVPRGSVQIAGSHRYIFRVDGNRLHRAEIKVGMSDASKFEVVEGLQEGSVVAMPGDSPLKDNMVVRTVVPE